MVISRALALVSQKRSILLREKHHMGPKYVSGSSGNKYTWHPSKCLTTVIMQIQEGAHPA